MSFLVVGPFADQASRHTVADPTLSLCEGWAADAAPKAPPGKLDIRSAGKPGRQPKLSTSGVSVNSSLPATLFPRPSWSEVSRVTAVLRRETVGGALLLVATVIALVLANSPWADGYFAVRDLSLIHI